MTTPSEIETSSATALSAPDNEADVRRRSTSTPTPREETLGLPRADSVELQWFDRYSQLMVVLACTFVGVSTSALAINGFDDHPAVRVPLVITTITAWFTLALLFQTSLQVYSLKKHEWRRIKRILMFPGGFLILSGLTFVITFLASTWTQKECDLNCRTAGGVVERVLVTVVMVGGSGLICVVQRGLERGRAGNACES